MGRQAYVAFVGNVDSDVEILYCEGVLHFACLLT